MKKSHKKERFQVYKPGGVLLFVVKLICNEEIKESAQDIFKAVMSYIQTAEGIKGRFGLTQN